MTATASIPKARWSGASAIARPTTEQFGFVTMPPPDARVGCASRSARWSAFTSGITSGTSGLIRNDFVFETTSFARLA